MRTSWLCVFLAFCAGLARAGDKERWNFKITFEKDYQTTRKTVQRAGTARTPDYVYVWPDVKDKEQTVSFTITIQNLSGRPATNCVVRYALVGQDLKSNKLSALADDSKPLATLAPYRKETFSVSTPMLKTRLLDYHAGDWVDQYDGKEGVAYKGIIVVICKGETPVGSYVTPTSLAAMVKNRGLRALGLDWPALDKWKP